MDLTNKVQTLNKAVCISLYANPLRKDMNPSLLPLVMLYDDIRNEGMKE